MVKRTFKTVDDYIDAQPEAAQRALARVRNSIRKALPGATEVISYNMPTYKRDDVALLHFAAWKDHYSLYGATQSVVKEFKTELRPYAVEKGTIRFALTEPVPERLITRIAQFVARD